jgi:hypothetical protein
MKKKILIISLLILAGLVTTQNVFADLPGSDWWSAIFMQNIGGDDETITMQAYESATAGSVIGSDTFSFNYGQSLAYDPGVTPNYSSGGAYIGFVSPLTSGFEGSVVLSASTPVAAISTIANYANGSVGGGGGTAAARYQGAGSDALSNTLFMGKIKNNFSGHTTTVYAQAAGSDADITATYRMNDGNVYTQDVTIEANRMFMFDPSAAGVPSTDCETDSTISRCYGSLTLESSTGPIAATIVEHPHTGSPTGFACSTRVQTPSDTSTKIFHPAIKNEYNGIMNASAAVMNVGTGPALVQITLTVTNVSPGSSAVIGEIYTDQMEIGAGESKVFSKFQDNLGDMPSGTYAAAVIESIDNATYDPQQLISSTNDRKVMSSLPGGYGLNLYSGYPDHKATNYLAAPTVLEHIGDLTGTLTMQNVGTAPARITYSYYEYGTDNVYRFATIDLINVGQAINTNQVSTKWEDKFYIVDGFTDFSELDHKQFSVIAESDQPFIGLVAEYNVYDERDIANYEAINFTP